MFFQKVRVAEDGRGAHWGCGAVIDCIQTLAVRPALLQSCSTFVRLRAILCAVAGPQDMQQAHGAQEDEESSMCAVTVRRLAAAVQFIWEFLLRGLG